MKKHIIFIIGLTMIVASLEAGRGAGIAGGVLGGMAIGAMLNEATRPRVTYVEQPVYYETPVYYESAPIEEYYYESSPTYYEEYTGDGYDADREINRHINMHQRDNVLERTRLQRQAQAELDEREARLDRKEQELKEREASLAKTTAQPFDQDYDRVYEDPFEEFYQK